MSLARKITPVLLQAIRQFPALVITGPRRAGKTTLLRTSVPGAQYVLLEDPDIQERVRSDPRSFLENLRFPVILDEIQNAPRLLDFARFLLSTQTRVAWDSGYSPALRKHLLCRASLNQWPVAPPSSSSSL